MDLAKRTQRNIRVPAELWAFVQSQAKKGKTRNGDCSAVIRQWIIEKYEKSLKNQH